MRARRHCAAATQITGVLLVSIRDSNPKDCEQFVDCRVLSPALHPPVRTDPATHSAQRPEWVHEVKWDGWRLRVHKWFKDVRLYTRQERVVSDRFPAIINAIKSIKARSLPDTHPLDVTRTP